MRLDCEQGCRIFFDTVRQFLLSNREQCLAYVRYYYSPYFVKYSADRHRRRYQPLLDKISPAFKEDANVWMLLNHILNVMLDFSVNVHNGHMPDSAGYAEQVFGMLYASVRQYFRE